MAEVPAGLQDAIAEAVAEVPFIETPEVEDNSPFFPVADPTVNGEAPKVPAAPAAPAVGDPVIADEDLPDTYWGTDLSGLSPDQKRAVIAATDGQEGYIHKLQERLAKFEQDAENPPAPVVTPEEEELSDADILSALGFDPEYADEAAAKPMLALARTVIALEDTVDRLSTNEAVRETETAWNGALDELEASYGKILGSDGKPVQRVAILQEALSRGYASPFETYFQLTAPVKREVDSAVAAARRAAEKRAESGGLAPRSAAKGSVPVEKKEGMSFRDMVGEAAKAAEQETGISWKQVVKTGKSWIGGDE